MRTIVEIGETLRLYLSFADINTGLPLDPETLTMVVTQPDGTLQTITYPSADFIRESAGEFFARAYAPLRGTYHYEAQAGFASGDIDIRRGKFDAE